MTSTERSVRAGDGTPIHVRTWTAEQPVAFVLLVHGLGEHGGRYEVVGQRLAAAGIQVTAYDQRGFGASGGKRAWVQQWSELHDDLGGRLAEVRREAAERPVVLYGHSLGGLIALGYVLTDRPKPDALVVTAPAIGSALPGWKLAFARLLSGIAPGLALPNGLRGDQLAADPAVGVRYAADPLNVHRTTLRFGAAGIREQRRVAAALPTLALPTLLMHGGDDPIVPPSASRPLAALPGVTFREWPGLRHEIHNETSGPAVVDEIAAWIRVSVLGSRATEDRLRGAQQR